MMRATSRLRGHPRLPSHGRSGTFLALYFRVRVCSDRRLLRVRTSQQRSVAATGAQVNTLFYYAIFRFPPEPNGVYGYNALQQLAYFVTIFIMAPLSNPYRHRCRPRW